MKTYWVYIMSNVNNTVMYTGGTSNLSKRVGQHRSKDGSSFTSKYNITKLVFHESFDRVYDAIAAEKKIKGGSHGRKVRLIESINPDWDDLSEGF